MRRKIHSLAAIGLLTAGIAAADEDGPTISKDSVQVTAFTFNVYKKNFDVWSWVPRVEFRVNGPLKFDCKTGEVKKGHYWKTDCGARDIPEEKGSTYTGAVDFAIKMRNELNNTDETLFTGKMKVVKAHSNELGPKVVNHFVYYVDQDWNLPIGYVFLTPGSVAGMQRPQFNAAFWYRGDQGALEPHLFY